MNSELTQFFTVLREKSDQLPHQQKAVCQFILGQYQEVAFMTVEQLAQATNVGVATVIRTVKALGFSHFSELLDQLKVLLLKRESSFWWQLEGSWEGTKSTDKPEHIFREVAQENIVSIQKSCTTDLAKNLVQALMALDQAQKIAILGLRTTAGVASYFASMLMEFRPSVYNAGSLGSDSMFALLADLTEQDVLFVISLGGPHYAVRSHQAAEFVKTRGGKVIALVTELTNPIVQHSDVVLVAYPTNAHYSVASVITVLESLVTALGRSNKARAVDKLNTMANVLKELTITF